MNLLAAVRKLFEPALAGVVPNATDLPDYLAMVKPAADPRNGDYQANFAMKLAKVLGRPNEGAEIAGEIAAKLPPNDVLESTTVAGKGFLNLKLKDTWIADQVRTMAADARLGVAPAASSRKVIVEYSSPNVAKPLH